MNWLFPLPIYLPTATLTRNTTWIQQSKSHWTGHPPPAAHRMLSPRTARLKSRAKELMCSLEHLITAWSWWMWIRTAKSSLSCPGFQSTAKIPPRSMSKARTKFSWPWRMERKIRFLAGIPLLLSTKTILMPQYFQRMISP